MKSTLMIGHMEDKTKNSTKKGRDYVNEVKLKETGWF